MAQCWLNWAGSAGARPLAGCCAFVSWWRSLVADDHAAALAPGQVAPGQVDQRGDPVPVAEQPDQVQYQPGEPGDGALDLYPARQLHDGGAAADRRHDPLVLVTEPGGVFALREPAD